MQLTLSHLHHSGTYRHNLKLHYIDIFHSFRDDEDTKDQLLEAVADGSYELVSSGHCARDKSHVQDSFTLIPQGVVGAEERLCLVYERGVAAGKMQLSQLVSCTSTAAAKLLNVYPRKGCIAGNQSQLSIHIN